MMEEGRKIPNYVQILIAQQTRNIIQDMKRQNSASAEKSSYLRCNDKECRH